MSSRGAKRREISFFLPEEGSASAEKERFLAPSFDGARNDILVGFFVFLALLYGNVDGGYAMESKLDKATFAGGCFWGMEKLFGEMDGVKSTRVGYSGGTAVNPSYEEVCTGRTGHAEAIEIVYDPVRLPYEKLLETFWSWHDPTTLNRQGNDVGTQYRSAIFYQSPEQKAKAEYSKKILEDAPVFKRPIVTEIVPASEFYEAED